LSDNKNLKIIVISSKGGVGKSTISMQLIAPYLYETGGGVVPFYEFDDENCDSLSYGASQLTTREVIEVGSTILKEELTDIFSKKENACLDIGGNKTTTIVLNALDESGMIHFVDLAVIPLLDGEQDGINASIVYTTLKDMKPDLKFVFVLNRAKNHRYINYQFDNFFGDVRGILSDVQAIKNYLFDGDHENYVVMLDDDIIKYSRRFGLTIYEIAQMKKDFSQALKLNKGKFSQEQEVKVISFKNYIQKASSSYYEDVLQPAFLKLNQVMEMKDDNEKS
jgi:cellulose biosynthesis protein BcsQ